MKTFILSLIFASTFASADEMAKELSDKELKNKFVAVIKDVEVEGMLNKTAEFNDCRTKYKFTAKDKINSSEWKDKIEAAQKCFKEKLGAQKDPEKLKKLSDVLGLQSYGVVQSKNVKDISDYLADKMYKAMTGIDRQEQNRKEYLESLKFKNRKHVDQKDFIDMYMTQLGKSALFEISRYCFEDLRNSQSPASNWDAHWAGMALDKDPDISAIKDDGKPAFFTSSQDLSDKHAIYTNIFQGITSNKSLGNTNFESFFSYCTKSINLLCSDYKKSHEGKDTTKAVDITGEMSKGAKSCLVMSRLQAIRKAIANTEIVQKQFNEMSSAKIGLLLEDPEKGAIKFYDRATEETSIDNLTNVNSSDILDGGYKKDRSLDEKIKDCSEKPELAECENYLVVDDSKDKALFNAELNMSLRTEAEIARVKAEKEKGQASLQKFLEDNGYFDIIEKLKTEPNLDIEKEIAQIFSARKEAELNAIKNKLGSRQLNEEEAKDKTRKSQAIEANIKETKEERARLAQVVLFNNIITSHLKLYKVDGTEKREVGQNVGTWEKEAKGLKASKVDMSLFDNIQKSSESAKKPANGDNSIVGLDMLDAILGKKP